MLIEYWKPIPGYLDLYEISSFGRVRSLERFINDRGCVYLRKSKLLKLSKNKDGYLAVTLYKSGQRKTFKVHRLVAMAFIPNPDNLPMINHKDCNPANNTVENLEWCTQKYNVSYGTANQRRSKTLQNCNHFSKPVYQYTLDGVLVRVWPSAAEAGRNGFCESHVAACCRGERKTHRGYIWSYTPIRPF